MPIFRGMLFGFILTFVVSLVLGSNGSTGAFMAIHSMPIDVYYAQFSIWWSWPGFLASTGIATGILAMMK